MSLIDTYQLATSGQNYIGSNTLASNGILFDIRIIDLLPDVVGGGAQEYPEAKSTSRKEICVVATIDGTEYKECLIVKGELPTHARGDGMGFGLHRVCVITNV